MTFYFVMFYSFFCPVESAEKKVISSFDPDRRRWATYAFLVIIDLNDRIGMPPQASHVCRCVEVHQCLQTITWLCLSCIQIRRAGHGTRPLETASTPSSVK